MKGTEVTMQNVRDGNPDPVPIELPDHVASALKTLLDYGIRGLEFDPAVDPANKPLYAFDDDASLTGLSFTRVDETGNVHFVWVGET